MSSSSDFDGTFSEYGSLLLQQGSREGQLPADAMSILTKSHISRVAQTFVLLFILGQLQTCLFSELNENFKQLLVMSKHLVYKRKSLCGEN